MAAPTPIVTSAEKAQILDMIMESDIIEIDKPEKFVNYMVSEYRKYLVRYEANKHFPGITKSYFNEFVLNRMYLLRQYAEMNDIDTATLKL